MGLDSNSEVSRQCLFIVVLIVIGLQPTQSGHGDEQHKVELIELYKFTNTEINNKKASEFETKSLLYLIGMRADSKEIEILTVDCFNDITGANESFSKLWDVQSKNHKSLPPSKIGESLLTLYKNFISSFDFAEYILFIPKLKRDYLIDSSLNVYGYRNIHEKQRKGIERYLIKKLCNGKEESVRPALLMRWFLSKTIKK